MKYKLQIRFATMLSNDVKKKKKRERAEIQEKRRRREQKFSSFGCV